MWSRKPMPVLMVMDWEVEDWVAWLGEEVSCV